MSKPAIKDRANVIFAANKTREKASQTPNIAA
jgi:hypothetical protein